MKWQSIFSPIFYSNFFLGFENKKFETIGFPQQVLAYFYLLMPEFAPFEKKKKTKWFWRFQSPKAWKKNH